MNPLRSPILFRTILVFMLFPLCNSVCTAQLSLGISGQTGLTNIDGLRQSRLGGRVGVTVGYALSPRWALDLGVGYLTIGNRRTTEEVGGAHDLTTRRITTRMNASDAALLVKYRIGNHVEVAVGPSLTILHQATDRTDLSYVNGTVTGSDTYTEDHTGFFQQLDFGVRPTVSVWLSDAVALRLSYHQGLRNISTLDGLGVTQRQQALLLGLDWAFWKR
jgi:Outer membrane protein beta-barrel domain